MLIIGSQTNDPNQAITIDYDGLLHHSLIVGQSGGGKSYLVARLVEEILLRTKARVLIIDPNGDFREVSDPCPDIWEKFNDIFKNITLLSKQSHIENYDDKDKFFNGWKKRRFTYLAPGRDRTSSLGKHVRKLLIHWDKLEEDQRRFLLDADASEDARLLMGLKAATENAKWVSSQSDAHFGFDLRGLQCAIASFSAQNIPMASYEYAKLLTSENWLAVHAKIDSLLSQYSIWWSQTPSGSFQYGWKPKKNHSVGRPHGLSDFIDGPFVKNSDSQTYWDALILSLEASPPSDTLLTADVALSRMWYQAKRAWRTQTQLMDSDNVAHNVRVPTFIVIDEAHNFAPDRSRNALTDRVTSRLLQIASEGRKYGLYLILATQRPTKLHRELVPECENGCVLRLQSKVETDFAQKVLGLSVQEAYQVPSFTTGQGVFFGRWVGGQRQMNTKVAPARITVGGGEIGDLWKSTPDPTPDLANIELKATDFVLEKLETSTTPLGLASLAKSITSNFGEDIEVDWFGYNAFKNWLRSLNIENLAISSLTPGYAYIEGIHEAPKEMEREILEQLPADEKNAIALIQRHIQMPFLPKESFRLLLEKLSDEIQENEFNLLDTSKNVRDQCVAEGHNVGRRIVNFVIRAIHFSGHRFDSDLPQSPDILAKALVMSVLNTLSETVGEVEGNIKNTVELYLSGGLLGKKADTGVIQEETTQIDVTNADN